VSAPGPTAADPAATTDLAADHALLLAATRAAGALALEFFQGEVRHWEKRPGDPVSEADMAVNALLEDRLRGARPGYGWLSEESPDDPARRRRARLWIVDPIDGTRAFLAGRPEFAVAVALVDAGGPLSAAVFNPATDEMFEALAGGGARLNGAPLRVSSRRALAGARLLISRTETRRADWVRGLDGPRVTAISSMAYKLALVAAGRHDAAVTLWGKSEWDIVAGDLLVRESGGRVGDATGAPFTYNAANTRLPATIAAGPTLFTALVAALGKGR